MCGPEAAAQAIDHIRTEIGADNVAALLLEPIQGEGGFIVPGPRLMAQSLHAGTSDLAAHSAASTANERTLFADNTRDAIERGCRVALAALVDRAQAELARVAGSTPALVMTGGAAPDVAPFVLAPVEIVPDLVLRGVLCLTGCGAWSEA